MGKTTSEGISCHILDINEWIRIYIEEMTKVFEPGTMYEIWSTKPDYFGLTTLCFNVDNQFMKHDRWEEFVWDDIGTPDKELFNSDHGHFTVARCTVGKL